MCCETVSDMRNYNGLTVERSFTPEAMVGDTQCAVLDIIDNGEVDGERSFRAMLVSSHPLLRVATRAQSATVTIEDDDRTSMI